MKRARVITVLLWIAACDSPAPPMACTPTLPEVTLYVGESKGATLCFETDELPLTYDAVSSDEDILRANAGGTAGWVRVDAVGIGEAIVTIKATDANGKSAYQTLTAFVPNRPPEVIKDLRDVSIAMWSERRIYLPSHISDPDGQPVRWFVEPSDNLDFEFAGDTLVMFAKNRNATQIELIGTDTEGESVRLSSVIELGNPLAYITQAAHGRTLDVPLVAGREGLLRLFLASEELVEAPSVTVRLKREGGTLLDVELEVDGRLSAQIDESDMERSYNVDIDGEYIAPGLAVEIDIAPTTDLTMTQRIRIPLEVREPSPIELTLIPVVVDGDLRSVSTIDEND